MLQTKNKQTNVFVELSGTFQAPPAFLPWHSITPLPDCTFVVVPDSSFSDDGFNSAP